VRFDLDDYSIPHDRNPHTVVVYANLADGNDARDACSFVACHS
jgi:hypothetical protein